MKKTLAIINKKKKIDLYIRSLTRGRSNLWGKKKKKEKIQFFRYPKHQSKKKWQNNSKSIQEVSSDQETSTFSYHSQTCYHFSNPDPNMIFFRSKTRGQTWEERSNLRVFDSAVGGVGIRSVDAVVDGLADEVDAEGDEGGAEAREGVAYLVADHRVLPPLVPPPEELPRRSQRLRHCSISLLLPLSLSAQPPPTPTGSPFSQLQQAQRWRRCMVSWNDQFIQELHINYNLRTTNFYKRLDCINQRARLIAWQDLCQVQS